MRQPSIRRGVRTRLVIFGTLALLLILSASPLAISLAVTLVAVSVGAPVETDGHQVRHHLGKILLSLRALVAG